MCAKCNDTGEFVTALDGKEYPSDSGIKPAGGGSIHECTCDRPEHYEHEYGKFRDWWDSQSQNDPMFQLIDMHCRQTKVDRADGVKLLVALLLQKITELKVLQLKQFTNK